MARGLLTPRQPVAGPPSSNEQQEQCITRAHSTTPRARLHNTEEQPTCAPFVPLIANVPTSPYARTLVRRPAIIAGSRDRRVASPHTSRKYAWCVRRSKAQARSRRPQPAVHNWLRTTPAQRHCRYRLIHHLHIVAPTPRNSLKATLQSACAESNVAMRMQHPSQHSGRSAT